MVVTNDNHLREIPRTVYGILLSSYKIKRKACTRAVSFPTLVYIFAIRKTPLYESLGKSSG